MLINTFSQPRSYVSGDGPENAPILMIVDCPAKQDLISRRVLSGQMGAVYLSQFRAAGIEREQIRIESVAEQDCPGGNFHALRSEDKAFWRDNAFSRIRRLVEGNPALKVIIPVGEESLRLVTGKKSLHKYHLSPLTSLPPLGGLPTIPLLSPHYIMKIFRDIAYISFGAQRIKELLDSPRTPTERRSIIRPSLEVTRDWIKSAIEAGPPWLAIDVETGAGQITCVGFAISASEGICIPTLPTDWRSPEEFHAVWKLIKELCESDIPKTNQNILYDATYLNSYGIMVKNVQHDTMAAMRFLHPELNKGLDNVARIYAYESYWKDDAKDWNSRQNIDELYLYNCKDTTVVIEATLNQVQSLKENGGYELFKSLVMDCWAPAAEMCWNGFPVKVHELQRLRNEVNEKIEGYQRVLNEEAQKYIGKDINPNSYLQVRELLRAAGFIIPLKNGKETSDYAALCEMRLKAPDSQILDSLLNLSKLIKQRDSYLNYRFNEKTARMHFTLYINSTETGRWAGGTDPWDRGMNVQTVPPSMKGQFGYE